MPTYNQQAEPGQFLQTTNIFDVQSLFEMDVNSKQFKEFIAKLSDSINNIVQAVNLKDTGIYDQREFVCGQIYYPNPLLNSSTAQKPTWRQVFRREVTSPAALPDTNIVSVAHGITITDTFTFTRTYGIATNTALHTWIPLPYASTTGNIVELWGDDLNINIRTNYDASAYNVVYTILEYIKN